MYTHTTHVMTSTIIIVINRIIIIIISSSIARRAYVGWLLDNWLR